MRCVADADIWMAGSPVLRPVAQYALGVLMVMQRADGGNTIYFLGHVAQSGGWIYFPALFLLKEPIPTLAIVLFGLLLGIWWTIKRTLQRGEGHIGIVNRVVTGQVQVTDSLGNTSVVSTGASPGFLGYAITDSGVQGVTDTGQNVVV